LTFLPFNKQEGIMPLQKKQTQKPLSAWADRLTAMQDGAKAAMENYNPSAFVQGG
jgi:hypothetical protein